MPTCSPKNHLYSYDSSLSCACSLVVMAGEDAKGRYFIPKQTIFRPEEGGQPADRGVITTSQGHFSLLDLQSNAQGEIKHYIQGQPQIGDRVFLTLDLLWRQTLNAYHTAGHLIKSLLHAGYLIETTIEEVHTPNQSYIAFIPPQKPCFYTPSYRKKLVDFLVAEIKKAKDNALPVIIDSKGTKRVVQITGFASYACTGTHVSSIAKLDMQSLTVKQRRKPDEVVIFYDLKTHPHSFKNRHPPKISPGRIK